MKILALASNRAQKLIWICALIATYSDAHIAASLSDRNPKVLHYGPEKVTLTGKLFARTFYGPPNYGENPKSDSKENQYILLLDSAIDVVTTGSDPTDKTEHGIKKVTLVVSDFKAHPVKHLLGSRVKVEGTLFHATTGHHHTKVLLEVFSIKRAG